MPLEWAATQFNMGFLFLTLGERTDDIEAYANAKRSFEDAHDVFHAVGHTAAEQAATGVERADDRLENARAVKADE